MTTPLLSEPLPGDGQVPYMSTLVHRLYYRLPEIFRVLDAADSCWTFKRYLAGVLELAGQIDDLINGIAGTDAIGPSAPQPWGLSTSELAVWLANRTQQTSILGDPVAADLAWLLWLGQLVGAQINPAATEQEQRDTIRYATSGYRGGTRQAIIDAAKSALTGTQRVALLLRQKPSGGAIMPGTVWDLTIVTRPSETADPAEVLAAVNRKGVKPAGVTLWVYPYEASWADLMADFPLWTDRNAATWQQQGEAGL
jgi:hypothetical protein